MLRWFYPFTTDEAPVSDRYTQLRAGPLLHTIEKLTQRIGERFPESGLLQVSHEFYRLAGRAERLAVQLRRPLWGVRTVTWVAAALLLLLVGNMVLLITQQVRVTTLELADVVQATESAINELIFLALAVFFLINVETRLKRGVALRSLHELRSIAHVVDMHQLTKDPARLLGTFTATQSSPTRTLSRSELTRYLDYCSELLALDSKIAALFAQNSSDPVVLAAVNDLESLTQGLAGKIWQKIMILDLAED